MNMKTNIGVQEKTRRSFQNESMPRSKRGRFWKQALLACGILTAVLMLSACGAGGKDSDSSAFPQAPIEVAFSTEPESGIKVGEPVELVATVTQEGKLVKDAELVRFEIWHEDDEDAANDGGHAGNHGHGHAEGHGADGEHAAEHGNGHHHHPMDGHETNHEMIEAKHRGDGQYAISYTFSKTGTYYVMYHVDARGFHAMTAHEVIVE